MNSDWYALKEPNDPLAQGDIVFRCPLLAWQSAYVELQAGKEAESLAAAVEIVQADVIVMTQACDLAQNKVQNVLVCPHFSIAEYEQRWSAAMQALGQNPTSKAWKKQCDIICDGYVWNLAMLNCGTAGPIEIGHRIVDFHQVFTLPRSFLELLLAQRAEPRVQLCAPYREHLSQAFARFFMRVGLPSNISKDWNRGGTT